MEKVCEGPEGTYVALRIPLDSPVKGARSFFYCFSGQFFIMLSTENSEKEDDCQGRGLAGQQEQREIDPNTDDSG